MILKRIVLRVLLITVGMCLFPKPANAQEIAANQAIEQAKQSIEAFRRQAGEEWGFAAAVWADGHVVWSEQWGPRDKQKDLPVTAETMFRIGSVSKLMTVMTLAAMLEQKQIGLDTTINSYLTDLPEQIQKITPRMLAGHQSGIRHYDPKRMQQEYLSQTAYENQREALHVFIDDSVQAEPGQEYLYSTYGYTLLGAVLESAGQKPLTTLMREHVFVPAGMQHSFGEHNEPVEGELAAPWVNFGGRELPVPPINNSGKLGGGGIVSTPVDLARFLGATAEHKLVAESTLESMFESQATKDGSPTNVGIGWRIATDHKGRRFVHHGGSAAGGRAFVLLYPDAKVAVAMCMNLSSQEHSFDEKLALQVIEPFLGESKKESNNR